MPIGQKWAAKKPKQLKYVFVFDYLCFFISLFFQYASVLQTKSVILQKLIYKRTQTQNINLMQVILQFQCTE